MWYRAFLLSSIASLTQADGISRADSHAPIGVMGDHTHSQGEWMLSLRYMAMEMEGNLMGSEAVSRDDIHSQGYMTAPESMTMKMHMLGGMYAPTDQLTLMLMVPVVENNMDLNMRMPMSSSMSMPMSSTMPMASMDAAFSTASEGLGDIKIGSLFSYAKTDRSHLILNFTLSLPTASINQEDQTPMSMGQQVQLPYPMQLGSGSYDIIPGVTYTVTEPSYSWGAQTKATIRLGENNNDYRLSDRYMVTSWYARPFADNLSWSARLAYQHWDNIDGMDSELSPSMLAAVPTANPKLRGGERAELALGLNWIIPGAKTHRLSVEVVKPIYQHLNGPQMESDYAFMLGWQLSN